MSFPSLEPIQEWPDSPTRSTEAADRQPPHLLAELIEDAETKRQLLLKIDAMQDISQADRNVKRSRLSEWRIGDSLAKLLLWRHA